MIFNNKSILNDNYLLHNFKFDFVPKVIMHVNIFEIESEQDEKNIKLDDA